ARLREVVDVVADAVAVGPVLSVARDRAVDEAGIEGPQRRVVDAEAGGDARAEAFEQDVGAGDEPPEHVAATRVLEVEDQAPLVAREKRNAHAERIAGRGDEEHVGAEVGEQRRAKRPRELAREVEDAEARERRGHRPAFSMPRRLCASACRVPGRWLVCARRWDGAW